MNNNHIIVDTGSSTVKAYKYSSGKLHQLFLKTIAFYKNFDEKNGISNKDRAVYIKLIQQLQKRYPHYQINLYGTAIFRKMSEPCQKQFISFIKQKLHLDFHIISHDEENEYIEQAVISKFNHNQPILLMNVGGGSTELVVVKDGKTIERQNVTIGVGTVNLQFPHLNKPLAGTSLQEVIRFVQTHLPTLHHKAHTALNIGGLLMFVKLTKYTLHPNSLFKDEHEPYEMSLKDFSKGNEKVYNQMTIAELEKLIPDNPKWLHGTRASLALMQALCEKYNITTIIPSDFNLVHGILKKDFATINSNE